MILSEVKQYLSQRGSASLSDIALHFDTNPDALRGMLQKWISKGKVRRQLADASCGSSCNKCDPATTEIYEWVDSLPATSTESGIKVDFCNK